MKKKGRKRVRTTADRRRVGLLDKQARKAQREERRKDGQNGQQSSKQSGRGVKKTQNKPR